MSSAPLRYKFDSLPEHVGTRGTNKDLDRSCLSWETRISKLFSDSTDPSQVFVSEKAYFVLRHVTRWQAKRSSDGFDEGFD